MGHLQKKQRDFICFIFITIALGFNILGCHSSQHEPALTPSEESIINIKDRHLHILVVSDPNADFTTISSKDLNGNYTGDLTYYDFSDVLISIDNMYIPLDNAIRDGAISVYDIIALARADAKNDFCQEFYESELGLSRFIYQYSEYEVHFTYDVFEASDGTQHLVENFGIFPCGAFEYMGQSLTITNEAGERIDLKSEDWGITLAVLNATPTSVTIEYAQSGGVQIGELITGYYYLIDLNGTPSYLHTLSDKTNTDSFPSIKISSNATSQFTLDWQDIYGKLPAGKYKMELCITEKYDNALAPTLMKNYTDKQYYDIFFEIL